ncbi:putative DTW domain-containing protein DTWD2/YfiP [Helianthus debilis subsp. tardiflorus]|nr:putative DTW domain-containing protein DTWD2/YfiP [Helianthus annuus]
MEEAERGRRICLGCERPASVCLCDFIPGESLSTTTQIVILQHPHEQRHPLATVPLLNKCLTNCETLIGRRLRHGHSPLLDFLHDRHPNPTHAAFLFPGMHHSFSFLLLFCAHYIQLHFI